MNEPEPTPNLGDMCDEDPQAPGCEEEEPTDEQKIVLEETEGGGTLVLSWGTHQWSAPFRIVGR